MKQNSSDMRTTQQIYFRISACILFKLLNDFKNLSGLVINPTKTEGMWIRSNKTKPFGIKWPNKQIKALGVEYSNDPKSLPKKNFIDKMHLILVLHRSLSVWKVDYNQIFNYLKVCLNMYPCCYPPPRKLLQFNQFLWKGIDKVHVKRLSAIKEDNTVV